MKLRDKRRRTITSQCELSDTVTRIISVLQASWEYPMVTDACNTLHHTSYFFMEGN